MRIPVDKVRVTPHGAYGYVRRSAADGRCGKANVYPCTHKGIDLAGNAGTEVKAPERSRVVIAAFDDNTPPLRGFGPGAVMLKGDSGAVHILGHLDPEWWRALRPRWPDDPWRDGIIGRPRMPNEGRLYQEGEVVGVTSSPADHVHWQVSMRGKVVDPMDWLRGRVRDEPTIDTAASSGGGAGALALLALGFLVLGSDGRRRRRR